MLKKQKEDYTIVSFDSLSEVVNFITKTDRTEKYEYYHNSDDGNFNFRGTKSMQEALDLLKHGWDEGTKQINSVLNSKIALNNGYKNKTIYDVAGYQCSVPRYLQGIPTNMINSKHVVQKQKVVNVIKDFGYAGITTKETMIKESIKVLKAIDKIESQGTRCNVYVSFVSSVGCEIPSKYVDVRIKIKDSSQRMNIKQMAFPLAHPSMFRRICFALIERLEETKYFGTGYGRCTYYEDVKHIYKKEYYIPRIINEDEIVNMNKYWCD